MKTVLKNFINQSLFDASAEMLEHLHIKFSPQSKTPIHFGNLYFSATSQHMPKQLAEVIEKVKETFFIGTIDEESLHGHQSEYDLEKPVEGKYQTMMVFAVDIKQGETLTRSELSTITRGFNRMASSLPVILFVKNGNRLSLATCERSEYRQDWRDGEKLGKVSILRDINLEHPHRGHIDILETLGDKAYPTFDDLYKHWLDVFSSELLTKKFYTELSEWYAWVIGSRKVKFPNNINTTEDDTKYNHEAVIRLITRLIFVWFLKQKKLIPEEFFNEDAIRENFIENFDPHSTNTLFYNPEESKYYRLILQNLFFAMLNRPIKDEETGNDENRRFVTDKRYRGISTDFNINNLLRYKSEFKAGGADKLLEVANSQVPFLNGGLFECLDHKDKEDPEYGMYYDGFTENKVALSQLAFPDYFFFGEEVGADVDLSGWYDDKKKAHSKVRGLINILRRYNFTVEENTPLDQEVSLDPELLGKVFENLLASYNPETKLTARKQTGSFYTPREIVQYMVDESLIGYLKRACPSISENTIRSLFDYSDDNFEATEDERKTLMSALHSCKVIDPACGSGAFPMGILQQMVHALRKLDPSNEMWREFILELALGKDREAYNIKDDEERSSRRKDIEEAFNRSVNDPDYARKLYMIENCIYGVDIQPIATQISKLRFFISLVADQNPTKDPFENFGIRPLPNLEAKIVAANSLVPLGDGNLFTVSDKITALKKKLEEANHKLFIAKRNAQKRKIREEIRNIRKDYLDELKELGAVDEDGAMKLAKWDMFDPNIFAKFFDPLWMFGISKGFDIVIGNPPYGISLSDNEKKFYKNVYKSAQTIKGIQKGSLDTYSLFIELSFKLLRKNGYFAMIIPISITSSESLTGIHRILMQQCDDIRISSYAVRPQPIFLNAMVNTSILLFTKTEMPFNSIKATKMYRKGEKFNLQHLINNLAYIEVQDYLLYGRIPKISYPVEISILSKIKEHPLLNTKLQKKGSPIFYRFAGGRYFKVITNYSTGSSAERVIYFEESIANAIGAILSSNLSFWFYQIYSDNLNWKSYELEHFPIPDLTPSQIKQLNKLYEEYLEDIELNANKRTTSGTSSYKVSSFTEYKIGRSKSIIDKIDDFIGPIYGLNSDEIEYVKNYEIDFRLSDSE